MKAYESMEKFPQALLDCQSLIKLDKNKEELYKKTYEEMKKKYELKLRRGSDYKKIEFVSKSPHLRSKKPLKRIEITEVEDVQPKTDMNKKKVATKPVATTLNYDTEIPDDIVDKIFDNATGEASSQSNMFSKSSRSIFDSCAPSTTAKAAAIAQPSSSSASAIKETLSTTDNKKVVHLESEKIKLKNELNAKNLIANEEKIDNVEDVEKIEDAIIPDIPKSGSQFHVIWRELSNSRKYLFLKVRNQFCFSYTTSFYKVC